MTNKTSSCAYVRVSSRTQNYATQRAAIEQAAQARGDAIGSWYKEKRSGKVVRRPELDRLRADVREGHISRVYLFKLDRLTRSGIRDTFEVIEEFRRHGCDIVSVTDGFDLEGPAAEVVLAVMAWSAKMERLAINERIAAARNRVESEGRQWGRPRRMGHAVVDQAAVMRAQGRTIREIAIALKVPKSTVQRALASS